MATTRKVFVHLEANPSGFIAGMKAAQAAVGGLRREIDTTNDRTAWLAQGILAIGPILAPLGAAAVPVLAGLTTGMTVAAGAAGVLALGFQGIGDATKALNDYQLEPTAENFEKMHIALEKIGPAGADFVKFVDDIAPKFSQLQMTAREGMFPGMTEGLNEIVDMLPRVNRIVEEFAEGLGRLSADAGAGLSGPGYEDFFNYMETEGKDILVDMGHTIGNFVEGLGAMIAAFGPMTADFSDGFLAMSESFAEWAHGLSASEDFQEFLVYVEQAAPKALDLLAAIGNAFVELLKAAAPVGDVMVPLLSELFDAIAMIASTPLGPIFLTAAAAMSIYGRAAALASITTGNLVKSTGKFSSGLVAQTAIAKKSIPTLGQFGVAVGNIHRNQRQLQQTMVSGSTAWSNWARGTSLAKNAVGGFARSAAPAAATAGLFALSMSDLDDKMGLTNTTTLAMVGMLAGPWGSATGAAIGLAVDFSDATKDLAESFALIPKVIESGDLDVMKDKLAAVKDELAETAQSDNPFDWLSDNMDALGLDADVAAGQMADLEYAIAEMEDALNFHGIEGGDALAVLLSTSRDLPGGFLATADAIAQVNDGLVALSGWLDKREALRNFDEAMKELNRSIAEGKVNEWAENVDGVGRSLVQVAAQLKGVAKVEFIDKTIASLRDMAEGAGPKAAAEIEKLIRQLKDLDTTDANPNLGANDDEFNRKTAAAQRRLALLKALKVDPTLDLETNPFIKALGLTKADLAWLDKFRAEPGADLNDDQLKAAIRAAKAQLAGLDGDTAHTYVDTHFRRTGSGQGQSNSPNIATGGYIRGPGTTTSDEIPAWLSDKEYVVNAAAVEKYGVDFFHRANAMMLANGGLVSHTYAKRFAGGGSVDSFFDSGASSVRQGPVDFPGSLASMFASLDLLDNGLRGLSKKELAIRGKQLDRQEEAFEKYLEKREELQQKEVDADKERLQATIEARDAFAEQVGGLFRTNVFENQGPIQLPANFMSMSDEEKTAWYAEEERKKALQSVTGLQGDINDLRQAMALYKALVKRGFDGPAFRDLVGQADVETLRYFSRLSDAELGQIESLYNERDRLAQQNGQFVANSEFGKQIVGLRADYRESVAELKGLRQEDREFRKEWRKEAEQVTEAIEAAAEKVKKGVNDAAVAGAKGKAPR